VRPLDWEPITSGAGSVYVPGLRPTAVGPWVAYRSSSAWSEAPPSTSAGPAVMPQQPPPDWPVSPENTGMEETAEAAPPSQVSTAIGQARVRGPSGGCGAAR